MRSVSTSKMTMINSNPNIDNSSIRNPSIGSSSCENSTRNISNHWTIGSNLKVIKSKRRIASR